MVVEKGGEKKKCLNRLIIRIVENFLLSLFYNQIMKKNILWEIGYEENHNDEKYYLTIKYISVYNIFLFFEKSPYL